MNDQLGLTQSQTKLTCTAEEVKSFYFDGNISPI